LVGNLKAFVGSGIGNRIIALFDNDTAARVAMKGLQMIKLPDNFRVFTYPVLEFAKNYPTIGPGGLTNIDINGVACSLELYLGSDVLTVKDKLSPVQWKGYDESLGQYQGEILNKKAIQKSFLEKLEKCCINHDEIEKTDWASIRLILQMIFEAVA
jgi:hypothetical protein